MSRVAVASVPAGTVVGAAPAGQRLTVQVWLASSLTAAAAYATAVSTPGNAEFHHYLSPDAYTSRFGSPAASAAAVTTWLGGVLGVTGLNTAPPARPATAATASAPTCSHYWAPGASTGTAQTVALIEDDTPVALFQTLGDYANSMHLPAPKSAQVREQHISVSGGCGSTASRAASQMFYPDEEQLDSEAVYAMAPGASQLMVIGQGCNEDQDLLDGALAVLTGNGARPSASIESNSWQIPLGEVPAATVHAITVRAAAEGVGLYFASGDTPGLTVTASDPFVTAVGGTTLELGVKNNRVLETGWSDDYAALENGKWTDIGVSGGGGGTSLVYGQPAYQKGVVPASIAQVKVVGGHTVTDRAGPDLAADGDPDSGLLTGYIESGSASHPGPYQTEVNAGTSLATPLIAGLVADAQQGQKTSFGFINPVLYRLAGTAALHDILSIRATLPQPDRAAWEAGGDGLSSGVDVFDAQHRPDTSLITAKGYDTMTGIGTPNGTAFIAGLRRTAS